MKLTFTKMHGAGNDFIVIDAINQAIELTAEQCQRLADRRFGIGADQILVVQSPTQADTDFTYRIFNADGGEVEQCGNGARAFVRFVTEKKLTDKTTIRVATLSGVIAPTMASDGSITVDMGAPEFALESIPFDGSGLHHHNQADEKLWQLDSADGSIESASHYFEPNGNNAIGVDDLGTAVGSNAVNAGVIDKVIDKVNDEANDEVNDEANDEVIDKSIYPTTSRTKSPWISVVSMGNPHAVQIVDDVDRTDVADEGPAIESHPRFGKRVNAGFMQIVDRGHIRLRVYERGTGETLACGTGACAAVVAGMRRGLLDSPVRVSTRGGELIIAWAGAQSSVFLSGPAVTVYEGVIQI